MSVEIDFAHFPNSVFRSYIASTFDKDADGILSDDEISKITDLWLYLNTPELVKRFENYPKYIRLNDITTFAGIEYLSSLESFHIYGFHNLISLDLNSNSKINDLWIEDTSIENIIYPSEKTHNKRYTITLYRNASLTECYVPPYAHDYHCDTVILDKLDLSDVTNIWTLGLGLVDPSDDPSNTVLDISNIIIGSPDTMGSNGFSVTSGDPTTSITNIILGEQPYLAALQCTNLAAIESLNISGCPNLRRLDTLGCQMLKRVNISQCPFLIIASRHKQQTSFENLPWALYRYIDESSPYRPIYELAVDKTTIISGTIIDVNIIKQPEDIKTNSGENVNFVLEIDANDCEFKWEKCNYKGQDVNHWVSVNGSKYQVISSEVSSILSFEAEESDDYTGYRCRITSESGILYSESAKLIVITPPQIYRSPQSTTIIDNTPTYFDVIASGNDLMYQWQFSSDNGTNWSDIRNSNTDKYEFIATLSINSYKYRCVVSNELGEAISDPATLTVIPDTSVAPPVVITQPSSVTVAEGSSATFAVEASGSDISYQWQVFKSNQWTNIQNATSASYTTVGTRSADGNRYRCVISNAAGAVYSDPVTLMVTMGIYVSTPRVLTQPRSVNVELGELVTFWIRADGGDLSCQWQKLNNGTWYDITGATSASYVVMAKTEVHNTQYRCVVTNTAGSVTSNTATLSIRAGHDLSFYGYHSIIISGKNTYGEWEMYPTSRPHVAPPEVKTSYVDLPGADGGLDYTDLLTGEPRYGYRKGSWEFLLIPQDRWAAVYRSLVNFLHGRQHTVILEDDPNYVYTGRLSVNEWQSAAHNSLITIDYILEPFPRNISGQEEDEEENQILSMASTLLNKEKNAGMVIGKLNGAATLIYPDMLFDNGDNIAY